MSDARVALEAGLAFDLGRVLARAVELYGARLTRGAAEIETTLRPFIDDRIRYVLEEFIAGRAPQLEGRELKFG